MTMGVTRGLVVVGLCLGACASPRSVHRCGEVACPAGQHCELETESGPEFETVYRCAPSHPKATPALSRFVIHTWTTGDGGWAEEMLDGGVR